MSNSATSQIRSLATASLGRYQGGHFASTIERWLEASGPEWTVERLKALRIAAIQLKAGNLKLVREIYQSNSIAYYKGSLLPKGPYYSVVRNFSQSNHYQVVKRADTLLRAYTAIKIGTPSEKQVRKTYQAINGQRCPDPSFLGLFSEYCSKTLSPLRDRIELPRPSVDRLKPFSVTSTPGRLPKEIRDTPYGAHMVSALSSCWLPDELADINPNEEFRQALLADGVSTSFAGHLTMLQEGGCKGRVVAVPNLWIQWLMEPLHKVLDELIQWLPSDCVHNQRLGAGFIRNSLREGKKLFCFDLSSATDVFPIELQSSVLQALGLIRYALSLEKIAQYKWDARFDQKTYSYRVGQPMGCYGSFPLFHLTHLILLSMYAEGDNFRILGDDVIINDSTLARKYANALHHLDVPISMEKTIESERLGEFAGFIGFTTKSGNPRTYRPFKYPSGSFGSVSLNLISSLGNKVCNLGSWWEKSYQLFIKTTDQRYDDLTPFLEEDPKEGRPPSVDVGILRNVITLASYGTNLGDNTSEYLMNDLHKVCSNFLDEKATRDSIPVSRPELQDRKLSWGKPNQFTRDPLIKKEVQGSSQVKTKLTWF
uniref:RNA-dependent RNA polymerase n=1 Tax=la Roche virus TaxID=2707289 RepID=A0A6H0DIT7_9VIRU|nr:MAG: RNA-dependent RNA polymerase [la Roche virus]